MKTNLLNRIGLLAGTSALLLACGFNVAAADRTWDGGDTTPSANWSAVANWDGDLTAPTNADNLIFTGPNQTFNVNDIANLTLGWILFDAPNFSVSGSSLTLSGGITNSVNAGGVTVDLPVTLSGAQTFVSDSGTLQFNQSITNTGALTVAGAGSVAWSYISNNLAVPIRGLLGSGNLIVNGTLNVGGGFVYPVNVNNFPGNTIVNSGGILYMAAGTFDGNSLIGQSLTINPGGAVYTSTPHIAGASGRPLSIYGGTLDMGSEAYFTTIVLSNATLTTSATRDLRGSGAFTNLASSVQTSFGVSLNLTSSRTIYVEEGSAEPDIDFTGNGTAAIQGGSTLIKAGPGKMAISGPATHTGATTISAGTLAITGGGTITNTPSITIASNAVFDVSGVSFAPGANQTITGVGVIRGTVNDNSPGSSITPGGNAAAGTLTVESLNLSGILALSFDLSTNAAAIGGGTNDLLSVTNLTLSTTDTNSVSLSALAGNLTQGVPYTLIKYVSCSAPAGPVATLAAPPSHFVYSFNNDTANSRITVTVTGNPFNLTWKGDGISNLWDIVTSPNWINAGTNIVYWDGDNVTFDNAGSNTPPVNIGAVVKPTTVTVNATKDYAFQSTSGTGKISGGGKLMKSNSGKLTITTDNDSSGGGSLTGSGTVVVGGTVGNLGSGSLTNNTKVLITRVNTGTIGANFTGTGSLFVDTPATITLPGASAQAGGLTINQGTVLIGANPTVSGSVMNGPITNYGTLYFSRSDAFTLPSPVTSVGNPLNYGFGDVHIRGAGGMTINGTAPLDTGVAGSLNVAQSIDGKLTVASGGLVNVGNNILCGNVANFKGEMFQSGGTINVGGYIRVAHYANNASTINTYDISGGTLNAPNSYLAIGWDGIALMTLSGTGVINTRQLQVDANTVTAAINGTNSTFKMTGGQLNVGLGGITSVSTTNQLVPTVQLSGGTIAAAAPAGFSSSLHMWLTNGTPTFDTSNSVITLSGVLKGNGGLTKTGTGVLQLDGVNTYTGTTTVNAGRLQGSGTLIGPLVVNNSVLSAGATLARATLTVSNNVTLTGSSSLLIDQASTAASTDLIRVVGDLTMPANTPVALNFTGGTPYTGGPNIIITNTGTRSGSVLVSNPTRYTVTVDQSNPKWISTSFSGSNAGLVWNGPGGTWDVNTSANWLNGGAADVFKQSDAAVFNGAGPASVAIASTVNPASVYVDGTYTFNGSPLFTVGSLVKAGSGTMTIGNDSTYNGGAAVNGGTLQIGNGASGTFTGNIANNTTVAFNRSTPSTYANVISGPGIVTVSGAGKVTFNADQTYIGGTLINGGASVQVGGDVASNTGWLSSGPITNNGTLTYFRNDNPTINNILTGNGSLVLKGTGVQTVGSYALTATNPFTGIITLDKARLQVNANVGARAINNVSSIAVPSGSSIYLAGRPTTNAIDRNFNPALTISGAGWYEGATYGALRLNGGTIWAGPITLAANARIGANNDSGDNRISGTINAGAYELDLGPAGFLTLDPPAPNTINNLRLSGGTVVLGNANALPSATTPLIMSGGTLRLNGNNATPSTYTHLATSTFQNGSSSNASQVVLPLTANATFGAFADIGTMPLHVTLNNQPNVTVTMSAAGTWYGNFTNNNGTINCGTGGGFGSMGNATAATNRYLVFNNSTGNLTINNATAGNSYANFIFNNSTFYATRYNSLGPVTLNASRLDGNIGASDGGYFQWPLQGGRVTVVGSAPSTMTGTGTSAGYPLRTPTVFNVADVTGSTATDLTVSAPLRSGGSGIGGTGALVKTGAGNMLVDAVATYTGATTVSNGVLTIGPSGSLASSTSFTVASGATLDVSATGLTLGAQTVRGSGTIKGNLTDGSGSIIAPGASAGTLTVQGDLNLGGYGSLAVEVGINTTVGLGSNDLIQVNGNLTLNDFAPTPVNFSFIDGNSAASYTIMTYTGTLTGSALGLTNTQGYAVTFNAAGGVVTATFATSSSISTTTPKSITWMGDSLGTWNTTMDNLAWRLGGNPTNFNNGDSVTFDSSTLGVNTAVSIDAPVVTPSITIADDAGFSFTKTAAGSITGGTVLNKSGTGTTTFDLQPNLVETINVNAGIFKVGGGANGTTGTKTVTVANGASFDFNWDWDTTRTQPHDFVVQGSGPDGLGAIRVTGGDVTSYTFFKNFTLAGNTVLGGAYRWDIGGTWAEYGSVVPTLNGQGYNITKVDVGAIDVRAVMTNVNSITVSNGTWFYENVHQTNAWTASTTNYVYPGAAVGGYGPTVNVPIVLDGGAIRSMGLAPTWSGPVNLKSSSVIGNYGNQIFTGPIGGPGAMWVDSTNASVAATLSAANSYSGGTVISNAPVTTASVDATAGSAAVIATHPNAFGSGSVAVSGLSSVALTTNASYFLTNVLRAVEFGFAAPGTVPNSFILPANTISNVSLHGRDSGQAINLSGVISGGFTGMTNWIDFGDATSVGVMRYGNTGNTFTGTISAFRGTLAITGDGSLGAAANVVRLNQNSSSAGLRFDAPGITLAHNVNVTATAAVNLLGDNNGDGVPETVNTATISGVISGAARIRPIGGGTLVLSGVNTHGGTETWTPGAATVQITNVSSLGAFFSPNFGGTIRYTGTGSQSTPALWVDNGEMGGTIEVQSPTAVLTAAAGGITKPLYKTGPGGLTLSGGLTSGLLNVSGGTLTLNNTAAASVPVTVTGAGTTLAGTGTINGNISLASGTQLKPGNYGIGTLTINAPVALTGMTTTMEIGTNLCDRLAGLMVTYDGTLNVVNLGAPTSLAYGTKFTLFSSLIRLGSFATVNLPVLPFPLTWTNKLAIDGSIEITAPYNPYPTNITAKVNGSQMIVSWPADHTGWVLQTQTNALSTGLTTNWFPVAGSSTVNAVTNTITAAQATVFYRLVTP